MNLKENIKKELRSLTEQTSPPCKGFRSCKCIHATPNANGTYSGGACAGAPSGGYSVTMGKCTHIQGQTPAIGMIIKFPNHADPHVIDWVTQPNNPCVYVNCQYPGITFASCDTCDTTPGSPCAIQWFQNPNATWASNWINNRDCSNYTWPSINLEVQALTIMAAAPNPQPNIYNNASDIWAAGNNSNLPTSPVNLKAQFIAKMAKAKYSQCQKVDCNC